MKEKRKIFDPANIKEYAGTYITENDSKYTITKDGKFKGRPSIDGADVQLIAGVEKEMYYIFAACLDTSKPQLKNKLHELILVNGKEPQSGLMLVVGLTDKSIEEKNRYGFVTSPIKKIKKEDDKYA